MEGGKDVMQDSQTPNTGMANLQKGFMEIAQAMSLGTEGSTQSVPNEVNKGCKILERILERMCRDIVGRKVEEHIKVLEQQLAERLDNRMQAVEMKLTELIKKVEEANQNCASTSIEAVSSLQEESPSNSTSTPQPPSIAATTTTTNTANNSCEMVPAPAASHSSSKDDVNAKLRLAASRERLEEVRKLLDSGADVNSADSAGRTALYLAVTNRGADIVGMLLSRGAEVNRKACDGTTPLHRAAPLGSCRCVSLLVGAGADVTIADHFGTTPLHLAANRGRTVAVRVLVAAGANPKVKDCNGDTPFDVAWSMGVRKVLGVASKQ